jgi:hypothetical protein
VSHWDTDALEPLSPMTADGTGLLTTGRYVGPTEASCVPAPIGPQVSEHGEHPPVAVGGLLQVQRGEHDVPVRLDRRGVEEQPLADRLVGPALRQHGQERSGVPSPPR